MPYLGRAGAGVGNNSGRSNPDSANAGGYCCMWGIIPAAGKGTRIQPLAFSKELLPLAGHYEDNVHKPRAVSDFLVERMILAGARKLCFVISPEKSDIIDYYSQSVRPASI